MRLIGCVKCNQMVYLLDNGCDHAVSVWECKSKVSGPCSPNSDWSHGYLECGWV